MGHAYCILSVHEITDKDKKVKLIKIRNPWGHQGEWNKDWSDSSTFWTEETKR